MARQPRKESLKVPVGAIHSNLGRLANPRLVEPGAGAGSTAPTQMALLKRLPARPAEGGDRFRPRLGKSGGARAPAGRSRGRIPDVPCSGSPFRRSAPWPGWTGTQAAPRTPIGNVWFRRTVRLTAEQAAKGGTLDHRHYRRPGHDLGQRPHRRQYVRLEHTSAHYAIPAGYPRAGANEIVFAASNSYGRRGLPEHRRPSWPSPSTAASGSRWPRAGATRIGEQREMPPRAAGGCERRHRRDAQQDDRPARPRSR